MLEKELEEIQELINYGDVGNGVEKLIEIIRSQQEEIQRLETELMMVR